MRVRLTAIIAFMFAATAAHGATIVTAVETGGDVVFTGSGSLNLTAWTFELDTSVSAAFVPNGGLVIGPSTSTAIDRYDAPVLFSGPANFGPGTTVEFATSGSGDMFGINFGAPNLLFVPDAYVSGTALSGSSTYSAETFASLGMTIGSYVWSWGSGGSADSFTLNVVPEPSTATLTVLGLIGLLATRRPRR